MDGYISRLRFEQEQQAVLMLNAYANAMNGGKSKGQPSDAGGKPDAQKVSPDALFEMMGVKVVTSDDNSQ